MPLVDLAAMELHNIERTPTGLRTRRGFVQTSPTDTYVAGFSIESPTTTEVWHYLFAQASTGRVTLHVCTEEFVDMYTMDLGTMQSGPVISWAMVLGQIVINSPSFSAPLYGLPGGGLIPALKTPSVNPDVVTLEIPAGHVAGFGDNLAIAQGNIVYFNDYGNGVPDPRTFIASNFVGLPGTIYDLIQGPDGALYLFTSAGAFSMPTDALGQGQDVRAFLSRIPGLETSRSRNAVASNGVIAVLQKDSIVLLPSMERIDLSQKGARRRSAIVTDVDDLRLFGRIYATPSGFVVGFGGRRAHWLLIDSRTSKFSFVWSSVSNLNLAGVLRSRDGEAQYLCTVGALQPFTRGRVDPFDGSDISGVVAGRMPATPGKEPVLRHVTVQTDNIPMGVTMNLNGAQKSVVTPSRTGDVVIGTDTWGASVPKLEGRTLRSVRFHANQRSAEPNIEILVQAGDFAIGPTMLTEYGGQGAGRRDAG